MKIEVEIDDGIYRVTKRVFGEDVDLGLILGAICRESMIALATHPEDFIEAFGEEAAKALPESMQKVRQKLVDKLQKK